MKEKQLTGLGFKKVTYDNMYWFEKKVSIFRLITQDHPKDKREPSWFVFIADPEECYKVEFRRVDKLKNFISAFKAN